MSRKYYTQILHSKLYDIPSWNVQLLTAKTFYYPINVCVRKQHSNAFISIAVHYHHKKKILATKLLRINDAMVVWRAGLRLSTWRIFCCALFRNLYKYWLKRLFLGSLMNYICCSMFIILLKAAMLMWRHTAIFLQNM